MDQQEIQREFQRDHQWMMGALSCLLAQQGIDYPLCPRSGDEAGIFRTQHDDNDDDDEEGDDYDDDDDDGDEED